MNFDGSNSITEKYNTNVLESSKNVVNKSSTESESSIEHDSTTVNENSSESNDGTEKDSSKTSKSIENIVLLRCRRPKSVRVKMRLELPRKHPKSIMLHKAKNHGPRICILGLIYLLVGLVWWDCSKEISSFINCLAIGLYLIIAGYGTVLYSRYEIKKGIPVKSNSRTIVMTLTTSIVSLLCLEIMFIGEFVGWYKFKTTPYYQLNTFFIDNDIVRNSISWIILLILSLISLGYLIYISVNLLNIEVGIYSREEKYKREKKLKQKNNNKKNEQECLNNHIGRSQKNKTFKNFSRDCFEKTKRLFISKSPVKNSNKSKEVKLSNLRFSNV